MSTPSALPRAPSLFNEGLAVMILAANFGMMAWLSPPSWPLWAMLGVLTLGVGVKVGTSFESLTENQRGRLLLLWPFGAILVALLSMGLGVEIWSQLPSLMFLSCFALMLIALRTPHRGISWALPPSLLGLMLNVLVAGLGNKESFLSLMALGTFNVLGCAYLSFTAGPALRNPGSSLARPALPLKAMVVSAAVALVVGLPVTVARQSLQDLDYPSFPGLPSISTSSATVFKATFADAAPDQPYWEYSDRYVWPLNDSTWITLEEMEKGYRAESEVVRLVPTPTARDLFSKQYGSWSKISTQNLMASNFQPKSERFFTYMLDLNPKVLEHGVAVLRGSTGINIEKHPNPWGAEKWSIRTAPFEFEEAPLEGLTASLKALYLSIPPHGDVVAWSDEVDMSGVAHMPQTQALVASWQDQGLSGQALVDRALEHFKGNLAYHFDYQSTDPSKNGVDYFLFTEQKGVCRHFANAFAMMMRLGGVPSRLVGGYAGGEFDESTNTWSVRRRDAHIWAEVWLEDQGWVKVDPTAVVPVEKGVPESALASHWGFGASMANVVQGDTFSTAGQMDDPSKEARSAFGFPSLPPMPPAVAAGLACLVLVVLAWVGWLRGWFSRSSVRPEDKAWAWAKHHLIRRGFGLPVSAGPATVGNIVALTLPEEEKAQWLAVVAEYERWKFAGEAIEGLPARLRAAARMAGRHMPPPSFKPPPEGS